MISTDNKKSPQIATNEANKTLASYFNNDEKALALCISFCFLIQRNNTGGLNKNELNALSNIKEKMVQDYNVPTNTLKFVVSAINNEADIQQVIKSDEIGFEKIRAQDPLDYCEIMSEHLPEDSGLDLRIKLVGDINKDLSTIESMLSLFLNAHTIELLSSNKIGADLSLTNPWLRVKEWYKHEGVSVERNSIYICCEHTHGQASSFHIIKSLLIIKNWLLRRKTEEIDLEVQNEIIERPSRLDKNLNKEQFMGIEPDFLSISESRPYSTKGLTSRVSFVEDVVESEKKDKKDSLSHNDATDNESSKNQEVGRTKRLIQKTSKLGLKVKSILFDPFEPDPVDDVENNHKGAEEKKDSEQDDYVPDYEILLMLCNGKLKPEFDLIWEYVDKDKAIEVKRKIERNIFFYCPKVGYEGIGLRVKNNITASWCDVSQGYMMLVNYNAVI